MGIELTVSKELANISLTATEYAAIATTVNGLIRNRDFILPFNRMVTELARCYDMVDNTLQPFLALDTETAFNTGFDEVHSHYKGSFLQDASLPRKYADEAYETYLQLSQMKEIKTGYPLLKRTFTRLDEFIDKWVTNDAWLAMNVDTLLKMLNRLLMEIAEFKKADAEDAYILYRSTFQTFALYLALIRQQRELLRSFENDGFDV